MSHCLPSPPPKPAAPTFQIAASSKQTQLITGPSLAVGSPCFSRTVVKHDHSTMNERGEIRSVNNTRTRSLQSLCSRVLLLVTVVGLLSRIAVAIHGGLVTPPVPGTD